MSFEAGFVTVYGALLLLGSFGLIRLGRVSTSPWSSRALAGHRRQEPEPNEVSTMTQWPHSEVPKLHSTVAAVASAAAALVATTELIRHHQPVEMALLGTVASLAAAHTLRTLLPLMNQGSERLSTTLTRRP